MRSIFLLQLWITTKKPCWLIVYFLSKRELFTRGAIWQELPKSCTGCHLNVSSFSFTFNLWGIKVSLFFYTSELNCLTSNFLALYLFSMHRENFILVHVAQHSEICLTFSFLALLGSVTVLFFRTRNGQTIVTVATQNL